MNIPHAGFRKYIAITGRRNVGKSSLINAIACQDIAIVSEIPGTTTDPVYKTLEIQPIGPVTLIDTPGIDDEGIVGQKRVERAKRSLYRADAAILVTDDRPSYYEMMLIDIFKELEIPFLIALNKVDLQLNGLMGLYESFSVPVVEISAKERRNIDTLIGRLSQIIPAEEEKSLIGHLLKDTKTVVLVVPIDKAAPKGRLIMPQVETIREIIDFGGTVVVTRDCELTDTLAKLSNNVDIVVTDSQVVMKIDKLVPTKIPLTTFSILEAANKGDLEFFLEGIEKLKALKNDDSVAVVEACSHVPTCDDIGRIKIPRWIEEKMKMKLHYKFFAGKEFPDVEELQDCKLIIHCGGCVLTRNTFMRRMTWAKRLKISVVNYGMLISYLHGVLDRVIQPLLK